MNIRDTHTALATLLAGLAITQPSALAISRVWSYVPPTNQSIVEPTILLFDDLISTRFGPNGLTTQEWEIHLELYATKAEVDAHKGYEIASSFADALITLLSGHQLAGTSVSVVRDMRGANPGQGTIGALEWGGIGWVGLHVIIPVTLIDERERAA